MDEFDSFLDDGADDLFQTVDLPAAVARPSPSRDAPPSAPQPEPLAGPSFLRLNPNRRVLGSEKDQHAYDETEFGGFAAFVRNKRMKLNNQRQADVDDMRARAREGEEGGPVEEIGSNMFRWVVDGGAVDVSWALSGRG